MQQLKIGALIALFSIIPHAAFAQEDRIAELRVSGNRRVAAESILFRVSSRVGDPFRPERLTQDLKTIWETGLFQNLGVQKQETPRGIVITFLVRELPIVTDIDYRGYQAITRSSITDKISEEFLDIPLDAPLDFRKINAVRSLIKQMLDDKGFRYGSVDYDLEYLDSSNARVVFNIQEGGKVRIREIEFSGNEAFTDRKLRNTMKKLKKRGMFTWITSKDIYTEEKFQGDVEKIKKKYWRQGYKDIFVGDPNIEIKDLTSAKQKLKNKEREAKLKKPKVDLRMKLDIPIFEGEQYTMGEFALEGNTVLPTIYYQRTLERKLKKGDVYDLGKINEWIEDLEKVHNDAGYINYSIRQEPIIKENNSVDVTFIVEERDQFYVNRISFSGNITTRDKVLRREILLREGDVFRLNFFRNSMLRINQLGYFDVSRDEPDINILSQENKVNIAIVGQESGINELNFGLGFSEFRGTSGFFSFSTLNFLGRGQKLQFQSQIGSLADTFDIAFTEPWLFDKPRGLSFRIFNTRSNASASGFTLDRTGLQIGMSFRPTTFSTYSVNYTFSEVTTPSVSNSQFQPINDLLTSNIAQTIGFDRTDHPFFPTRGSKASFTLDLASWQTGGDVFFYKVLGQATRYFKAIRNTFIGLNLKAAFLDTFEDQRPLRHELFFLGGEESVRGYDRQSLGPVDFDSVGNPTFATRGDKLIQANFEYIIPISDQLRFAIFYDAGMIYGVDEDWFQAERRENVAMSTGVEMRFRLPIFQAPLRLIYAFKLVDTPLEDKGGEPKFSIGTTF